MKNVNNLYIILALLTVGISCGKGIESKFSFQHFDFEHSGKVINTRDVSDELIIINNASGEGEYSKYFELIDLFEKQMGYKIKYKFSLNPPEKNDLTEYLKLPSTFKFSYGKNPVEFELLLFEGGKLIYGIHNPEEFDKAVFMNALATATKDKFFASGGYYSADVNIYFENFKFESDIVLPTLLFIIDDLGYLNHPEEGINTWIRSFVEENPGYRLVILLSDKYLETDIEAIESSLILSSKIEMLEGQMKINYENLKKICLFQTLNLALKFDSEGNYINGSYFFRLEDLYENF